MTVAVWMHLLLSYLCCQCKIQPAESKPEWMRLQFPCDVTADNNSNVLFDCGGRRLQEVPDGITNNATYLNLSDNLICHICNDSLSNLLNLTQLDLSRANNDNTVNITVNAFKDLTKLRELRLSGTGLEEIPANLPPSLEIIELNSNNITLLIGSFDCLANITQLVLARNCYYSNPCKTSVNMENRLEVMSKLKHLDLSYNNLTEVPKGFPQSLGVLKLDHNRINHIRDGFLMLPNLTVLKLEGNCPRCETPPHPCVTCPKKSLDIDPNAFQYLTQLEILNMGGNSLKHLDPSWFKSLNKLKQLFLIFNLLFKAITEEATFLRHLPKLERLDISFNYGIKLYPTQLNLSEEFSNLKSLQIFHLQGLVFQSIGPETLRPLYQLKNLSIMNLGTNFIIHSDSTVFHKFHNLKVMYLAENKLFPTPDRNLLDSSCGGYNQRSELSIPPLTIPHPSDFVYEHVKNLVKEECFNSGRVLSLSSNNMFFISPKQFVGYEDIACLNLSKNGFSAAPNGTEFSLLHNLTYLDLSFNKIDLAYNEAFKELKKLQVLDLSYNEHYFEAYGVTLNLNFTQNLPALRVLNMSHNSISILTTKQMYSCSLTELQFTDNLLGTLWKETDHSYESIFTNLINLTMLDISSNHILTLPDYVYEYLPRNLTILRIGHNLLTDFKWDGLKFFHQLQILDLSFNSLPNVTVINSNVTRTLTFLDLSHNDIFHLDSGFVNGAKQLTALSLSYNKLTIINESTFPLSPESQFHTLFLQGNPFQCTCDALDFIIWMEKSNVKIPRLITDVTCDTPAHHKDKALIKFDIRECIDDSQAFLIYILTSSLIIVFMFVATVSHFFYWDASYVMHYMKAKIKGYRAFNSPGAIYDVFVTYDTTDPHVTEWVMRNLRVKLEEEGEKHLPLCLEERDWTPGAPLVNNLTQSIQYSRKTLFVLTEGYVKTGVFKLAMYLAHQRLLDENLDVIVLLMLEPVLQHSHFLRLRRRLCEKSVVEWPRTAAAEPWFWQNLRNVVRVDNKLMYNKKYSKYFTSK
ncbi:toll-like receptor 8 [Gymnodraco acuticeps]|uniref:Toll-like receptor 8 n=2 Tax=Notothenioidei TaxID=8205 RepID=A0A6P8TY09_GYMAC|nr:toll-like receptor 8 [Gymnodraco acuticeps]